MFREAVDIFFEWSLRHPPPLFEPIYQPRKDQMIGQTLRHGSVLKSIIEDVGIHHFIQ